MAACRVDACSMIWQVIMVSSLSLERRRHTYGVRRPWSHRLKRGSLRCRQPLAGFLAATGFASAAWSSRLTDRERNLPRAFPDPAGDPVAHAVNQQVSGIVW